MRPLVPTTAAIALALVTALQAQAPSARRVTLEPVDQCRRTVLQEEARPGWTVSGEWLSSDELVLVDAVNNSLIKLDPLGRLRGRQSKNVEVAIKRELDEAEFFPVAVRRSEGGLWVELVGGRFVKLSGTERLLSGQDLWGLRVEEDAKLIAIFSWTLAGTDLFGYGNFRMDNGSLRNGFFRVNLTAPSDSRVLSYVRDDHPMQLWYRLANPYLASIGEVGYALWINDHNEDGIADRLTLVKSDPEAESLRRVGTFPGALRTVPNLPEFKKPEDFVEIMQEITRTTAPVGLYGWESRLFLLWRSQQEGNSWVVSRINPETRKIESRVSIDSEASHLMLVPGPKYWAFVEKGPVEGYGVQTTASILYVPTSEIQRAFREGGKLCG